KKQLQTKLLFITKKPGAFPASMPNEFGVCMVYGRCCVYDTTARARQGGNANSFIVCFYS
ncbi:hypothetical protein, partial [uncultured Dialister sp.]|uniref:hypothetical protein n=1 Tax=uncultured Dialister sp. TaxID=278064 RepID=UPI002622CAB7